MADQRMLDKIRHYDPEKNYDNEHCWHCAYWGSPDYGAEEQCCFPWFDGEDWEEFEHTPICLWEKKQAEGKD